MSDEDKGPCGKYCAVVDECEARGREIERLTRERDEAHQRYVDANEARIDAERKVEKLREALEPFAEKHLYPDDIDPSYADDIRADEDWDEDRNDNEVDDCWIRRGWIRRARAALKETKG